MLALTAAGCETEGRGSARPAEIPAAEDVTLVGCVDYGEQHRGLVLWLVDDPSHRPPPKAALTQSTTTSGQWVGTRQIVLEGNVASRMNELVGRRIEITGALNAQEATTGQVDQVQVARGVTFRRMSVASFTPLEGACAFDPRRREPSPPGDADTSRQREPDAPR